MRPQEYIEATARTWKTGDDHRIQIAHAAMGVAGECAELIDERKRTWREYLDVYMNREDEDAIESARQKRRNAIRDETGDVWYYLATLHRLLEAPFDYQDHSIPVRAHNANYAPTTMMAAGRVVEHAKGMAFLQKDCRDELVDAAREVARSLSAWVRSESGGWYMTTPDVWAANIGKPQKRYPNGFEKGGGNR